MTNLNSKCRVKLTEKGKQILNKENEEIPGLYKWDENGYFEEPLWSIMSLFGSYMFNGCDSPIEMEIELSEYI